MKTLRLPHALVLAAMLLMPSCSSLFRKVPDERPPLADMEEPLDLFDEPEDEAARQALPAGSFTGIYVAEAAESLDDLFEESVGLTVERVVENSPAAFAGIEAGDLLLEVRMAGGDVVELEWPSQWRDIELAAAPGTTCTVLVDRAGAEREFTIELERRLAHPEREAVERFREEERVGVVLRGATEVEARRVGLAPGAGAVVVGLSRRSPWRRAGMKFGDLIAEIAGQPVDHPRVILDAVQATESDKTVPLVLWRGNESRTVELAVSARSQDVHEVSIPPLYSYESERGKSEWSILYGFLGRESTPAAWRFRLLWFITFGGGDADELESVEGPTLDENEASDPADAEPQP